MDSRDLGEKELHAFTYNNLHLNQDDPWQKQDFLYYLLLTFILPVRLLRLIQIG